MILATAPLAMPWPTLDPFLFCVHHDDRYPRGNGRYGPAAALAGRQMGSDFSRRDGWSMYHGLEVPGFPAHPHRGFETVTLVRRGRIDHSDSLGAAARFGDGDVQWLTAGRGIVHAEMFPLLSEAQDNPLDLFQIWLNLPARSKMCAPYFSMLWAEQIPRFSIADAGGARTEVTVVAGRLPGLQPAGQPALTPLPPPPDSWASDAQSDLAIVTLALDPGARIVLPPAQGAQTRRVAYFFAGERLQVAGRDLTEHVAIEVDAAQPLALANTGAQRVELLLLQGRPIGEPVAQHGPFVMNTEQQIHEAFADYQRTRFGGWPWPSEAPVHGADAARFARGPGEAGLQRPPPLAQNLV
ncbi:pirin family protein [Aquabacterium sp.]|uniref:pirin family protein n=1 Tax=Aquabacterium sp. TaxID=1872578 RepID=UPI00378429CE